MLHRTQTSLERVSNSVTILHICTSEVLMVPHISSTENTMSFVFRESKESLHMIHAEVLVDVLLKTHARNKTTLHFCKIV